MVSQAAMQKSFHFTECLKYIYILGVTVHLDNLLAVTVSTHKKKTFMSKLTQQRSLSVSVKLKPSFFLDLFRGCFQKMEFRINSQSCT